MLTDFFLKLDGVKGESVDSQHGGEIEVESFRWGESMNTTIGSATSGAGAGKVKFDELSITTRVSAASPQLAQLCASGTPVPTAVLTARKAGGTQQDYYKVTFKTVLLTHYISAAVSGADLVPRDEITFAFGQFQIEYHTQNKDGTLGTAILNGWNQITNTKA